MNSGKSQVFLFTIADADATALDDADTITSCMSAIVDAAGFHELETIQHRFEPQGISAVAILKESHIAAHTWPEDGSAYITLTTCAEPLAGFREAADSAIRKALDAKTIELKEMTA